MKGMNFGDGIIKLERYSDESTNGGLTEQGRKELKTATDYFLKIKELIGDGAQDLPKDVAKAIDKFKNRDEDARYLSNVIRNWYESLVKGTNAPSKKHDKSAGDIGSSETMVPGTVSGSKNVAYGTGAKAVDKSTSLIINYLNLTDEEYNTLISNLVSKLEDVLKDQFEDKIEQTGAIAERKILDYLGNILREQLNRNQEIASEKIVDKVNRDLSIMVNETCAELKGLLECNERSIEKSVESLIRKYEYRIDEKTDSIIINLSGISEYLRAQNDYGLELAQGKECLRRAEFEGAKEFFDEVKNHKDNQNQTDIADAYFYSALAKWKVQLVLDNRYGCYQPICYDYSINIEKGPGNSFYDFALKCSAQDKQRNEFYKGIYNTIKGILAEYIKLEDLNLEYDCFICFKKTDENGQDTDDYKWIMNSGLVRKLENKGISTFYSPTTLNKLMKKSGTGIKYEATIYHALSKAKCLLLVCSKEEYLKTPWVENEYTRFCAQLKSKNPKSVDTSRVIIVFKDNLSLPDDLKEFRGEQHFDRNVVDVDDVIETVKIRVENEKGYLDENRKYCLNCRDGHGYYMDVCPICGKRLVHFSVYANEERRRTAEALKRAQEENERLRAEQEELKKRAEDNARITENKQNQNTPKPQEATKTQENVTPSSTPRAGTTQTADFSNTDSNLQYIVPYGTKIITEGQFEDREDLINVIIPNTVTEIEDFAFYDCSGLTSITIPDSVTSIGYGVFSGCGLTSIVVEQGNDKYHSAGNCLIETESKTLISGCKTSAIPNDGSVTSIGASAFSDCSSLTSITIPDSVTSIGNSAFYRCDNLTSITIPNSVTSIGDYAFCDCRSLTSITIPDSVTNIGYGAFSYCSNLTSITISDSVTSIGQYAFSNCTSLTSITIPDSVTSIGDSAFEDCTGLASITIPNSVTSIGKSAFFGCSNLTSAIIPDDITINDSVFKGCKGLTIMRKPKQTKQVKQESNDAEQESDEAAQTADFSNANSSLQYIVPYGTKVITKGQFADREDLINVIIPKTVTRIEWNAFRNCKNLKSITIPNSVTSIDDYAFWGCTSLKSITIPNSVTGIGWGAFSGCTGLTSVTIPDSVTGIESSAFSGCTSLTSVIIPDDIAINNSVFEGCKGLTITRIKKQEDPESVLEINFDLFGQEPDDTEQESNDAEQKAHKAVQTADFSNANSSLQYIVPYGTEVITEGQFENREDLINVIIPNTVTSIEREAFKNCKNLESITIPDSVTRIGYGAFANTAWYNNRPNALVYAGNVAYKFKGYMPSNTKLYLKHGTVEIASFAFWGCSGLTSITIPDGVTRIGSYAFYRCSGLTSITIPDSVTSIGWYAFEKCKALKNITIPDGVAIDKSVFKGCKGLTITRKPKQTKQVKQESNDAEQESDEAAQMARLLEQFNRILSSND